MAEIVPITFHGNDASGPNLLPGELGPDLPFHGFSLLQSVIEIDPDQTILEPLDVQLVTRTILGESVLEIVDAVGKCESTVAHRLGDIRAMLGTGNKAGFLLDCLISGVMHRTEQGRPAGFQLGQKGYETVELAAKGYTNLAIREDLGLRPRTVEHRFAYLYAKGQFRRRTLLTAAFLATREQVGGLAIAELGQVVT